VADCGPGDLDQLTCASTVTELVDQWVVLAAHTITGTKNCGHEAKTGGASSILDSIIGALDTSVGLMGTAAGCVGDPFACTIGVMDTVDTCNDIVDGVAGAVENCKKLKPPTPPLPNASWLIPTVHTILGLHHRRLEGENTTALPEAITLPKALTDAAKAMKSKAMAKALTRRGLARSQEPVSDAKNKFRARVDMFTAWVDELGATGQHEHSPKLVASLQRAREVLPRLGKVVFDFKRSSVTSEPAREMLV